MFVMSLLSCLHVWLQFTDEQLSFYHDNPDSFYQVSFTDALDLVQSRQVVVKKVAKVQFCESL